ncbi:hypothetical protein BSIN_3978 [Burkholderia singularis]|uniref:Uncharacterized protein n=1 Tax=Burkholderia singularis TaxID=1503053 RepID=A0A238H7E6_9BURK|nr:hypothetical protein BSIN_3978 [Burkholderia singularis]
MPAFLAGFACDTARAALKASGSISLPQNLQPTRGAKFFCDTNHWRLTFDLPPT